MDILQGSAGHSPHAPLSSGQTVALGRHLQDQIGELQASVSGLARAVQECRDEAQGHAGRLGSSDDAVHSLQDSVSALTSALADARAELSRASAAAKILQDRANSAETGIDGLQVAQAMAGTELQKLRGELDGTRSFAQKAEGRALGVEHSVEDLRKLAAEHSLELGTLRTDGSLHAQRLQEELDGRRHVEDSIRDICHNMVATRSRVDNVEGRLTQTMAAMQTARLNIHDLETASQKLREDADHSKDATAGMQTSFATLSGRVDTLSEDLSSTGKILDETSSRLSTACTAIDSTRQCAEFLDRQAKSLSQAKTHSDELMSRLQRELKEIGHTASEAKAGLRNTNLMVLPNLVLDQNMGPRSARDSQRTAAAADGMPATMTLRKPPGTPGQDWRRGLASRPSSKGMNWT